MWTKEKTQKKEGGGSRGEPKEEHEEEVNGSKHKPKLWTMEWKLVFSTKCSNFDY